MDDEKPHDKRVDTVKERLQDDLVDEQGNPVDQDDVARTVDDVATPLIDAPVQEFTSLLIEHQARDALREKGFHRDLGDDEIDAAAADDVH